MGFLARESYMPGRAAAQQPLPPPQQPPRLERRSKEDDVPVKPRRVAQQQENGHMELPEAVEAVTGVDASYLTVHAAF
jgi:hypothetical protein